MYEKGSNYKFMMKIGKESIYYTGEVLEEDSGHVKVKTYRGEEIVLSKEAVVQATKV